MKTKSTTKPQIVSVQEHAQIPNFCEVRVRENIEQKGNEFTYDEYILAVPQQENLEAEIAQNLDEWLKTGREQEASEKASTVQDMLKIFNQIYKSKTEQKAEITELQEALAEVYEMLNKANN